MLVSAGRWAVAGLVIGLIAVAVIRPLTSGGAILIILLAILLLGSAGTMWGAVRRRGSDASDRAKP